MQLQFVGCGDAFGSGGRFNTCFHVTGAHANFLIDCGASSLIALKALGIALNDIQAIFVTHFHADHFGGLPFFMLDSQFFSKRTAPLVVTGPPGLKDWYVRVMETAFPGSSKTKQKFDLELRELEPGVESEVANVRVTPYLAKHGQPEGPFFALRIAAEDRVVTYTGDTEWVEALIPAARGADLFVAEAYFRDKSVPLHLDLATLERHLPAIGAKRVVLTHMSDDMLAQRDQVPYETAEDGMIVAF
ncbi:MAG TPA: MBL fold metallo-hydrolase [Rhodospirillaceae bacterium]|nr:MBL fold metallo-hydrolase [Magnetovibrio sp.]HCS68774.1 MBL fold metallo-hydrolase [Rhodospirillaceae bacterium]|tara:strand:+ start:435 stop:1172 length:738 start_codon:yes stop_codon:yes gene_type:complete